MAVRVGSQTLGVRSNSAALLDELRALLAPSVLSGVEAYPNITIQVGEDQKRVRAVPFVYRRGALAARATSIGHAVRATLGLLETFGPARGCHPRLRPLRARALLGANGAVLVSEMFGPGLENQARRLWRDGLRIVPGAPILLDPGTLEVVVRAPRFDYDPDALSELDRRYPRHETEFGFEDVRAPVRSVAIFTLCPPDPGPAELLAQLFAFAVGNQRPACVEDLALLAALQQNARVRIVREFDIEALIAELRDQLRAS